MIPNTTSVGVPSLGTTQKKAVRDIIIRVDSDPYSYDFVDIRCNVSHRRTRVGLDVLYNYGIVFRLEKYTESIFYVRMWVVEKGTNRMDKISDNDISTSKIPDHIPDEQCFDWLKKTLCQEQQFYDRVLKPYATARANNAELYQPGKDTQMKEDNLEITNFKYKVTDYSDIMGGWVDENTKED